MRYKDGWDTAYILLGEVHNLSWVFIINEAADNGLFEVKWSEDRLWALIKITKDQASNLKTEDTNGVRLPYRSARVFRRIKTMAKRVWPDISLHQEAAMPDSIIAYDTFLYALGRGDQYVEHEVHDTTGKRIPPTPFARD